MRTLILSALIAVPAFAKPVPALSDYTREQVTLLHNAVNETSALDPGPEQNWVFKRFLLRIQAKVGFDVEVANIELIPELELVWQKEDT